MVAAPRSAGDGESTASNADPTAMALGRAFIDGVWTRDYDAIEALLAPDVRFRALVPRAYREATSAQAARAWIEGWFADASHMQLIDSRVEMVVDRLHLAYRMRLLEDGTWRLVEQNVFAAVLDARMADVALVCSGFRPVEGPAHEPAAAQDASGQRADAHLDAIGKTCATLTPDIRAAVRELLPGQVLEILTDDPTAADGLRSWTNLTGHELLAADAGAGDAGRFYIRRGAAPRTTGAPT